MKKILRDMEPLPTIKRIMPDASLEQQLEASAVIWRLFDSIWNVAERLVREENAKASEDDKARADVSIGDTYHV